MKTKHLSIRRLLPFLRYHYGKYISVGCLLFFSLFIILERANAQQENVWIFGNQAGVDFNGTSPTPITSAIAGDGEANASVCDEQGNLLFYTEGSFVWDRNNNLMPNGSDLTPYPAVPKSPTTSSSQGALIVPVPGKRNQYYIFSLTSAELNEHIGELYYSIVDMSLNSGLGDVVVGRKAIFLDDSLTESMSAVAGNNCNIWLLNSSQFGFGLKPEIKAREINMQGINNAVVISNVNLSDAFGGSIAVSGNREKIAFGTPFGLSILDFDPNTGILSNEQQISSDWFSGVCFSPDGTKLYSAKGAFFAALVDLDQFDLSAGSLQAIISSKTTITTSVMTQLKLAPDGKIYFAGSPIAGPSAPTSFLSVIDQPNLPGLACNPQTDAISLAPGYMTLGLSNIVPVIRRDTIFTSTEYISCRNMKLHAIDTSGWNYVWDDNSTLPMRTVDTFGQYWVSYRTPCEVIVDSFTVSKKDLSPVINVDEFKLSLTKRYDTYQWYLNGSIIAGATDSFLIVTENGDYTVVVSDEESGCSEASDIYTVNNYTKGINSPAGLAGQINIYPNPAQDRVFIQSPVPVNLRLTDVMGRTIRQLEDAHVLSLKALEAGVYLLEISNREDFPIRTVKLVKE